MGTWIMLLLDIIKKKKHGLATTLKCISFERVRPNPRRGNLINQFLGREAFWIHRFNTIEPHGFGNTGF